MSTTILLIRHGQTAWNALGRWQGHTDIPLNETGRAQAQAVARRLQGWKLTAVYASDLLRAKETAEIIAAPHGLPVYTDPNWRERGLGIMEGLTNPEIDKLFPDMLYSPILIEAQGAETGAQLPARAMAGFDYIWQKHEGETTAVVTHGGTIRSIINHILGFADNVYTPISLRGNTGITRIQRFEDGLPHITLLNDTAHLENGVMYHNGDCS
jgi:broad specificity phosphatase PhoE